MDEDNVSFPHLHVSAVDNGGHWSAGVSWADSVLAVAAGTHLVCAGRVPGGALAARDHCGLEKDGRYED